MAAHSVRLLDTGELPPVLDIRVELLAENRAVAMSNAFDLVAEVVSDVRAGRVA